jgi:peptidoglycan/xylan/chitin deacetylase (PgdA/CDA1 family)
MYSTLDDLLGFYRYIRTSGVLSGEGLAHFNGATFQLDGSERGFELFSVSLDSGDDEIYVLVNIPLGSGGLLESIIQGLEKLVMQHATPPPGPAHAQHGCGPQLLAFTFDDAPLPDTAVLGGKERTGKIIQALQEGDAGPVMLFSVSSRIDDATLQRMHDYADAGHIITNHSHTHPNLHDVGSEAFIGDVTTAHDVLRGLPGFQPFFRFPYLNEGTTDSERDAVRAALEKLGYTQGYVTIDNYDFYIDRLIRDAVDAGDALDLQAVGAFYTDMIIGAAEHYDQIACTWLGRSPRHVLLLHENDASALFLPQLIDTFRAKGWEIISALEAYDDPIAEIMPDTLFLGQGRVAALAEMAGADPVALRHEGEDTEVLRAAFVAANSKTERSD